MRTAPDDFNTVDHPEKGLWSVAWPKGNAESVLETVDRQLKRHELEIVTVPCRTPDMLMWKIDRRKQPVRPIKLGDILIDRNGVRWRATIQNTHWLDPDNPTFTLFTVDHVALHQATIKHDGTGFHTAHGGHENGQTLVLASE